jgi:hypothetical protein
MLSSPLLHSLMARGRGETNIRRPSTTTATATHSIKEKQQQQLANFQRQQVTKKCDWLRSARTMFMLVI